MKRTPLYNMTKDEKDLAMKFGVKFTAGIFLLGLAVSKIVPLLFFR